MSGIVYSDPMVLKRVIPTASESAVPHDLLHLMNEQRASTRLESPHARLLSYDWLCEIHFSAGSALSW